MEGLDELETQIREIIADHFDIDISEVRTDTTIAEFGGDSLEMLQLLAIFENRFGISISVEDAIKMESVKSWVEFIRKHLP